MYSLLSLLQENRPTEAANDEELPTEATCKDVSSAYLAIAEIYMTDLWCVILVTIFNNTDRGYIVVVFSAAVDEIEKRFLILWNFNLN